MQKKTLGIFGMGRIGQAVAKRAVHFGMNVIYHSRSRLDRKMERILGAKYVSFDRLVSDSDVLSIHVPYGRQTHQIINMGVFKKMKRTSFLVNTARGKIINEKDLVVALKSKLIAGSALDVYESEPIGADHPLTSMQNVVLAPHIGSSTDETRKKMAHIAVRNLVLGLEGRRMLYSVF
jgi:glyoxylate reductase